MISRSISISRPCCRGCSSAAARASLLITLGGFAIAYLMRPLGAVFFGHIGDRKGRRHMLLLSVAMMTAAMLATALLPTRAAIGPAAGWLLLLAALRHGFLGRRRIYRRRRLSARRRAARGKRGLIASSASAASEVGGLLAVGVSALTVAALSEADLDAWGWRIPFFVGAALGRQRRDRPLDDAGIARVRAPARGRDACPKSRSATPSPPPRRHRPLLRHLGARARSLIMSASPMFRHS